MRHRTRRVILTSLAAALIAGVVAVATRRPAREAAPVARVRPATTREVGVEAIAWRHAFPLGMSAVGLSGDDRWFAAVAVPARVARSSDLPTLPAPGATAAGIPKATAPPAATTSAPARPPAPSAAK
jgi:hypothetical protein